jgi:flagellar basal-body rod protein FlgF
MDRMIYTAMSGVSQLLRRQETLANNLANASTPGFRADLDALRAVPMQGEGAGLGTRVGVVSTTPGADFTPGTIQTTGRDLDVAIDGEGFIAVEGRDGAEAYTRNGGFNVGTDGNLQTMSGLTVLGDGGPIAVPENAKIAIGKDGTISATIDGNAKNSSVLGRIKLVNPPTNNLVKGADGLFRAKDGNPPATDPNVRLRQGAIETSNVNVIETMVGMISLARQFEMQMKVLSGADTNANNANKILSNNA